ncbi:uncharacterized protein A1O9_03812 [Exophiala aquamarina CBS 119918]|uniref:Uncharacterized protein n=1 Tax=Exophiala aquamarina CBS 119918 TaxID=1182545 RepID=A0A072PFR9_9EURO|nr:uncharacterized protein A1O9_03812 [Exophiala aquamarina CBS 119918]KEF58969.1 hypothetical protein A1O9_03812 [Exophiala aquamarina CBS 119918]
MERRLQIPDWVDNAIARVSTVSNLASNVYDRVVPDRRAQELSNIRDTISNLATQQSNIPDTISNLATQQSDHARMQTAATLLQASATMSQTTAQMNGTASISTEMGNITEALQSIATDMKTFAKPNVFGQIINVGSLITNGAAVEYIKKLADQAERMGDSLDRIADNVYSENSRGDKFPNHVYSYVRSMIEKHQEDTRPHYFFVFNQSTTWHAKFDDINRRDPLGIHFLGYQHDLDTLVAYIVEHGRPRLGPEPIVHILIPTIGQLAIGESLTFPEEMRPFRISGQLGESGLPFVYLCTPLDRDRQYLNQIGSLLPRPRWVLLQQVGLGLPIIGRWLSVPLDPIYFEDPYFQVTSEVGLILYNSLYFETTPVPPRILGRPR